MIHAYSFKILFCYENNVGIRVKDQNLLVGKTTVVNHENGLFILLKF